VVVFVKQVRGSEGVIRVVIKNIMNWQMWTVACCSVIRNLLLLYSN